MNADKIAVIGLGHFGLHLCKELSKLGIEVLGIDKDEKRVQILKEEMSHCVVANSSEKEILQQVGIQDYDTVVVAIGEDFESSLLTVAHLQDFNIKRIISRVQSQVHKNILEKMGVKELMIPEEAAAAQLAHCLDIKGMIGSIELSSEYSVAEIQPPKWTIGKTLSDLSLRQNYEIHIVTLVEMISSKKLLVKKSKQVHILPYVEPNTKISENHNLVVFGKQKNIKKFLES